MVQASVMSDVGTTHVMLEATAPIGTGHTLIVDDLDVQDGVRVVDVGHLSGDLGYPVLELGQGQSLGGRREITVVVGVSIHIEENNGAILTRAECRGGIAGVGGRASPRMQATSPRLAPTVSSQAVGRSLRHSTE